MADGQTSAAVNCHSFRFSHLVNPMYDGTALVNAQAVVICTLCGALRVVAYGPAEHAEWAAV